MFLSLGLRGLFQVSERYQGLKFAGNDTQKLADVA